MKLIKKFKIDFLYFDILIKIYHYVEDNEFN